MAENQTDVTPDVIKIWAVSVIDSYQALIDVGVSPQRAKQITIDILSSVIKTATP